VKIVQVLYSGLGGHGSVFTSIVNASRGTPVNHAAVFYGIERVRSEYLKFCADRDVTALAIEKKQGPDLSGQWEIFSFLREAQPDSIVLHSHAALPPALLYRFRTHRKTSLIYVEHQANDLKSRAQWIASAVTLWCCDAVVYLTEEYRQQVVDQLSALSRAPARSLIIPNGIDTGYFRPLSTPRENIQTLRVGMQARFTETKDHETLIRAFGMLQGGATLWLAGDGATRPRCEKLVADLGLSDKVFFLGMLDEHELLAFLQSLDIYVHATLGETQSTAILQAQACGLPMVASRVSGVVEQVHDGTNGLLVAERDSDGLALVLTELCRDPLLRHKLASSARDSVLKYDNQAMWEGYFDLFQSLRLPATPGTLNL
jgi:glycosyltransferase involved in cell wall biosynthesis